MNNLVSVSARKGGVGTSTVACSLAVAFSQHDSTLLVDCSEMGDTFAILGVSEGVGVIPVDENLSVVRVSGSLSASIIPTGYANVVVDEGVVRQTLPGATLTVSVVTNAYGSLRNETRGGHQPPNVTVLHLHENTPLNINDVRAILTPEQMVVMPHTDKMWRTIDAGLFLSRDLWNFAQEILPVRL